jgi:putative hydrolase of the HAD superfamily
LKIKAYLFDWGDTLMKDHRRYSGPMKDWPAVTAVDGAAETLRFLSVNARCCLATNARDSSEKDIRRALARVDLDQYLDAIFCSQSLRLAKPDRAFFAKIQKTLELAPEAIAMVGDSYDTDVKGALNAGMRAIWYNPHTDESRTDHGVITIHKLDELIALH